MYSSLGLFFFITSSIACMFRSDPPRQPDPPPRRCSLRYHNGLQDLQNRVFGQHIAVSYVRHAIEGHFSDNDPRHALSIVCMGNTGTGKNLISNLVADSAFGYDKEEWVHLYSGRNDFPLESQVENYKAKLRNDVIRAVGRCERSIFIFDEIEKMPTGIIDALKPFLDFHPTVNGLNFRKATFLFLTNLGDIEINERFASLRANGIVRNYMQYSHFEKILREKLFNEATGLFSGANLISDSLISLYVPFLPLEKEHVKLCIRIELRRRGMPETENNMMAVLEKMDFYNDEFSTSGCKRVADFVAVEKSRASMKRKEL